MPSWRGRRAERCCWSRSSWMPPTGRGYRRRKHLNQADLDGLVYVGAHAGREGLDPYLDRLAARTALYLDVCWGHVEILVDALLRRLKLTGEQVGEILRGVDTSSARSSSDKPLLQKIPPDRLGLARGVGSDPLRQLR